MSKKKKGSAKKNPSKNPKKSAKAIAAPVKKIASPAKTIIVHKEPQAQVKKHAVQTAASSKSTTPLLPEKKTFFKKIHGLPGKLITPERKAGLITFGTIALFAVPVIIVSSGVLIATDMLLNGRIMPGTTIANTSLAFMYGDDTANILQQMSDQYLKTPLTISVNGSQTKVTPQELGVKFSLRATLLSLPRYDLRKNSVLSLIPAAIMGDKVNPSITFDPQKAQSIIEQKLDLTKARAQNARIDFDAKKNPVVIAEAPGEVLDQEKLNQQLVQSTENLQSTNISLQLIDEKPSITAQSLEPQKQQFAQVLKTPITLTYSGQKWKFDPSKHLDAASFVLVANKPAIKLDELKMQDFLKNEIAAKIEHPTSDVKISTDANKKIIIEGKGQNGTKVATDWLLASLDLAMNTHVDHLEIPVAEEKANVTVSDDLQNLGIKSLIATGHTAFVGSHPGRIKNIDVGISRYNGLLVKQGETFSFNDHLGPVDGQHGFVQELVIKAEGTVPDYGGGLCQVSSTLYQAALFAGFPIVERASHSYAVSYYAQILGYGLDGTIYPGVHDIKFINNTPGDLVVQAYTEGTQAYFKFYGTDDGRKVWLEGPQMTNYKNPPPEEIVQSDKLPPGAKKQVEINHTGFDVTWFRHILASDGKETKETLFTRYDAVPAKIMVGADVGGAGTADTTKPGNTAAVPKT